MSDSGGNSSNQNGTGAEPLQRLASFKTPRDLSLGGVKPNKKIFTPNLNVARNKNKSLPGSNPREPKRDLDKGRHDRKHDRQKHNRNGPNIVKSSGVFSEGIGAVERGSSHTRLSYGQRADSASTLEKPVLRSKSALKFDKELENRKVKSIVDEDGSESNNEEDDEPMASDTPIRLPVARTGVLSNKKKTAVKEEVKIKTEPMEEGGDTPLVEEKKPIVEVKKEVNEDADIADILRSDQPTLLLLQLPDTLPGHGRQADPQQQPQQSSKQETDKEQSQTEQRCFLADLEEGRIGRLLIHRSGKVRLALGDTMFDVSAGTKPTFRQEAVSVACDDPSRSANIVALGPLQHKLNVVPDWELLFKDITV